MVRAFWVLNRQLTVTRASFRSCTEAPTSRWSDSASGSRCLRQERDSTLNSISAIPSASSGQDLTNCRASACSGTPAVSQSAGPPPPGRSRTATPCGGCSEPAPYSIRGCPGPPVPLGPPDRLHPPASASAGRNPASCAVGSPPPAASQLAARRPETSCGCPPPGTRSPAAGGVPAGVAAAPGSRPAIGGGGLVKADHRPLWVIGFGVQSLPRTGYGVQHILHVGHELPAHLGDAPLFLLPGLERVFFSRRRTPSWDREDANPNSATFPAKRRRVQWSWPSGAGLQASAIRACPVLDTGWASPRSSNFRCRLAWRRSHRDPANPSWVNRCLIRYTVPSATSRASATWGAAQPASLLSRIRALAVNRAELFPTRIRCCSSSRCSVASRTAYLSRTITATPSVNTSSPAVYGYRPDS